MSKPNPSNKTIKPILRETMPIYLGAPPKATSKHVTKSMKSNKAKDTTPELMLRHALSKAGVKGYRLNWNNVPGRPDISFISRKIAVFVNGCFWHRCPKCKLPLPKSNRTFWHNKFTRNVERDRLKIKRLKDVGWRIYTFWECEIKKSVDKIAKRIKAAL